MICCHPRLLFTARTRPRGPVTIPKRESRGEERRGGRGGGGGGERSCCCCNTKGRDALGAVCLAASSREIAFVQPEANQQTRTVQNEGASSIRRVVRRIAQTRRCDLQDRGAARARLLLYSETYILW
ncbi:hypothetical protein CISG_08762 [Coccidioides immitis RMSCC 3703]|uniref:Uncharacterized protein n=1 Tax=Coccidioides immitis RMSCC 3703 TaxID=454286 RepID=A0A0J8RA40_COCIT|nr:hypothetical protein CISG_08762 [Coccidioides immitis RMSCC 3703]